MSIKFKARKPIRLSKEMLKDKRVLYSVTGSIMVVVFLIWSVAPMMSTDQVPTNIFETQEIRGYDLSQMPFSTDLVEGELLGQEAYKDIAEKGSMNVIYSKEDKKQRIVADKFGVRDYRGNRKVSSSRTPSRSYSGDSGVKQTTQVNRMSSSGGFRSSGGGGSSTSSKVWTGKDSRKSYGYNRYGSGAGASGVGLSDADKKALAKQIALQRAGKLSEQAAGAEGEEAAESAAEAFAGGEKAADLDTELEQAAAELDLGSGEISGLGEGNLADIIDSAVDESESNYERLIPDPEIDKWEQFWMDVAMKGIDMIGNLGTSYFTSKFGGKKGGTGGSGTGNTGEGGTGGANDPNASCTNPKGC